MANDLHFKYGTGDLDQVNYAEGTVYVKKTANKRAQMFVDVPNNGRERLQIGGEIFVGDPNGTDTGDYEVVINPNGDIIENFVTSETEGGYLIKTVSIPEDEIDTWEPTTTPEQNTIILIVKE